MKTKRTMFSGKTMIIGPNASETIRAPHGGRWAFQSIRIDSLFMSILAFMEMRRGVNLITVSAPGNSADLSRIIPEEFPHPIAKIIHSQQFPSGGILIRDPHQVLVVEPPKRKNGRFELFFLHRNQQNGSEWFSKIIGLKPL